MTRFFMARQVNRVEENSTDTEQCRVSIVLDCGCEVERIVNRSRVIEVAKEEGEQGILVPGKFLCAKHSFDK